MATGAGASEQPDTKEQSALRRIALSAEKHLWVWPAAAIVGVSAAGALAGWLAAAGMTAFTIALVGALVAKVVRVKALALAAFIAAATVLGALAIRAQGKDDEALPEGGVGRVMSLKELRTMRDLRGAVLSGMPLSGMDLHDRLLQGAHAAGATLRGATLDDTRLDGADLSRADLRGASLERACVRGADLTGALLDGADFNDASVQGVVGADDPNAALHWGDKPAPDTCRD